MSQEEGRGQGENALQELLMSVGILISATIFNSLQMRSLPPHQKITQITITVITLKAKAACFEYCAGGLACCRPQRLPSFSQ